MIKGSLDLVKTEILGKSIVSTSFSMYMDKEKWDKFKLSFPVNKREWRTEKFFDSAGIVNPRLKYVKEEAGVFMCVLKPTQIPINDYAYIMFIDETTTNMRLAIQDFVSTKASSYLHDTQIRQLFLEFEDYLYVSYYLNSDTSQVKEMKESLVDLIHPPLENGKKLQGGTIENVF